jgi:1,4-alpha-glucan branching enzyme
MSAKGKTDEAVKTKSAAKPAKTTKSAPARRRIEFVIEAGFGRIVSVAGSFNDWDPEAKFLTDTKKDGVFRCTMMLPPGEYEYKFVVDGDWRIDENNPWFASNDLGTLNSVLKVE